MFGIRRSAASYDAFVEMLRKAGSLRRRELSRGNRIFGDIAVSRGRATLTVDAFDDEDYIVWRELPGDRQPNASAAGSPQAIAPE